MITKNKHEEQLSVLNETHSTEIVTIRNDLFTRSTTQEDRLVKTLQLHSDVLLTKEKEQQQQLTTLTDLHQTQQKKLINEHDIQLHEHSVELNTLIKYGTKREEEMKMENDSQIATLNEQHIHALNKLTYTLELKMKKEQQEKEVSKIKKRRC